MKVKIIAFLLALGIHVAYSQNRNVIPPSPNSSALGKYVDNPVSFYTGTPEIDIPLYEIKLKNFTLPIGLSYHAGGIKVEETASNVGLGWVLNAGGVITRAVKEIPDDYKAPYCPDEYNGTGPEPDCRNGIFHAGKNIHDIDIVDAYNRDLTDTEPYSFQNIFTRFYNVEMNPVGFNYKKLTDSEPDIFYFNFCGKSGQFVFEVIDGVRNIKFLSDYDFDIKETLDSDGKLSQFEVTDDFGNVYVFSAIEKTLLVQRQNGFPMSSDHVGLLEMPESYSETSFNSSWYLSKVTTPYGDVIDLTYTDEVTTYISQGTEQTLFVLISDYENYNPTVDGDYPLTEEVRTTLYGKRLESILSENTKIYFESDRTRQDVWGGDGALLPEAITGLTVYAKQLFFSRIKRYAFTQDYFESPVVSNFGVGTLGYYYNSSDDPSTTVDPLRDHMDIYFRRLRLRGIQEFGTTDVNVVPATTFEYKYQGFSGYTDQHRLPHRFSHQQDLWGYYNGAAENIKSVIPKLYVYPDMYQDSRCFSVYKRNSHTGREYTLPGANRLPSESLMDIGILTKINYPTGGNTAYEFEPHKFKDGNEEFSGGGLRIKKVTKHDGMNNGTDIVYNYSYSYADNSASGNIISMPLYAVGDAAGYRHALDGTEAAYKANTVRFSQPQAPLGNTKGSNIGYKRVTEYISGSGRTEYDFALPANWYELNDRSLPDPQADCSTAENGVCDGLYAATEVHDLFPYSRTRSSFFDLSMNPATINSFPFPENPNYDWNRGQLLASRIYNEAGNILRSEVSTYRVWYRNGQSAPHKVYGIVFGQYFPRHANPDPNVLLPIGNIPGRCWRVAKYHYLTDVQKVLASKAITEYEVGTANAISKTISYKYDGTRHVNPTEISEQMSNGDELITRYQYSYDYYFSAPYIPAEGVFALVTKKMRSVPVETTQFIKKGGIEYLQGARLITYYLVNNRPVPLREWAIDTVLTTDFAPSYLQAPGVFHKDERYLQKVKVVRSDGNGNVLEEQDNMTGLTTCYVWGYSNQYPVAKVVNATYADIENILGSTTLTYLNNGYELISPPPSNSIPPPASVLLTDEEVRSLLNLLRTGLPGALVSTYTYRPLVGMTSETDPNGRTVFYEYDNLNRLHLLKDHAGKIVKQYTYRYKGQ